MLRSVQSGKQLSVYLGGEIDHCASQVLRQEIDALIQTHEIRSLHLDFTDVTFIDSSGIGMIIGRYKTMLAKGGSITAGGLNEAVNRLYHLSGLHRIIPILTTGGQHEQH